MKNFLISFCFLLLIGQQVTAQNKVAQDTASLNSSNQPLLFMVEGDQLFYNSTKEKERVQIDTVSREKIITILQKEVTAGKREIKSLQVIIEGDDIMTNDTFSILLDTLLEQKVGEIRIRTDLF